MVVISNKVSCFSKFLDFSQFFVQNVWWNEKCYATL